jgi:hypothetical protein
MQLQCGATSNLSRASSAFLFGKSSTSFFYSTISPRPMLFVLAITPHFHIPSMIKSIPRSCNPSIRAGGSHMDVLFENIASFGPGAIKDNADTELTRFCGNRDIINVLSCA